MDFSCHSVCIKIRENAAVNSRTSMSTLLIQIQILCMHVQINACEGERVEHERREAWMNQLQEPGTLSFRSRWYLVPYCQILSSQSRIYTIKETEQIAELKRKNGTHRVNTFSIASLISPTLQRAREASTANSRRFALPAAPYSSFKVVTPKCKTVFSVFTFVIASRAALARCGSLVLRMCSNLAICFSRTAWLSTLSTSTWVS